MTVLAAVIRDNYKWSKYQPRAATLVRDSGLPHLALAITMRIITKVMSLIHKDQQRKSSESVNLVFVFHLPSVQSIILLSL